MSTHRRGNLADVAGSFPQSLGGGVRNVRPDLAGAKGFSWYWAEVLADNPVLFVPCDDVSGATARALVGANGVYVGSPTLRVAGPNRELPFGFSTDGTAQYVDVSTPTTTRDQAQSWEFVGNYPLVINSSTAFVRPLADDAADADATKLDLGSLTGSISGEVVTLTAPEPGTSYFTYWTGLSIPAGMHHWLLTYSGTRGGWTLYLDGRDATGSPWSGTKNQFNGGARGYQSTSQTLGGFTGNAQYRAWSFLGGFARYDSALSATRALAHARALGLAA